MIDSLIRTERGAGTPVISAGFHMKKNSSGSLRVKTGATRASGGDFGMAKKLTMSSSKKPSPGYKAQANGSCSCKGCGAKMPLTNSMCFSCGCWNWWIKLFNICIWDLC